ncbi:MAG: hypothetical protein WKG00_04115 [Polyangiaceae bacterium]
MPRIRLVFMVTFASAALRAPHAEGQQRPVRLGYDAPVGCPDGGAFSAKLAERSRGLGIEPAGANAPDVDVVIRADGQGYHGSLDVVTPDGPIRRSIDGERCADLVTALALSAALLLDDASQAGGAAPAAATRAGAAARVAELPVGPPAATRWSAGARLEASLLLASGWALGPEVYVGVGWDRASIASPSLRLGFSYAAASLDATERGSADLGWFVGRVSGCPLRLGGEATGIRPCFGAGAGAVHGAGTGEPSAPASDTALWAELDAGARAHALLFHRLVLELEGGAVIPLTRYRFLFERPEAELGRVRAAGARIAVGAGGIF